VLEPLPRQKFGETLAKYFSSSIDSSDGLATSLYELARNSMTDINVDSIPEAAGLVEFAASNDLDRNELVFHGGEEYEIIATIPKSKFEKALAASKRAELEMHPIGIVGKGSGRVYVNNKMLEDRGYLHFSRR
jgi:thiamine-monophosphate kinase